MNNDLFFVIYSDSSANSTRGLVPRVATATRGDILEWAWGEAARIGESLDDNSLETATRKLGDDGRLYLVFSEGEVEDFIEDAARFGVLEDACELAREVLGESYEFV